MARGGSGLANVMSAVSQVMDLEAWAGGAANRLRALHAYWGDYPKEERLELLAESLERDLKHIPPVRRIAALAIIDAQFPDLPKTMRTSPEPGPRSVSALVAEILQRWEEVTPQDKEALAERSPAPAASAATDSIDLERATKDLQGQLKLDCRPSVARVCRLLQVLAEALINRLDPVTRQVLQWMDARDPIKGIGASEVLGELRSALEVPAAGGGEDAARKRLALRFRAQMALILSHKGVRGADSAGKEQSVDSAIQEFVVWLKGELSPDRVRSDIRERRRRWWQNEDKLCWKHYQDRYNATLNDTRLVEEQARNATRRAVRSIFNLEGGGR